MFFWRAAVSAALAVVVTHSSMALADDGKNVTIGAFADVGCKTAVTLNHSDVVSNPYFTSTSGASSQNITFNTKDANWPNSTSFSNLKFDGASQNGSAGSNVYWKIPKPDPGCRYVMMLKWPQGNHSKGTTQQGDGIVALNVDTEACTYSTFTDVDTTMYWGTCCGNDCQHYSLNSTELLSNSNNNKRELDTEAAIEKLDKKSEDSTHAELEPALEARDALQPRDIAGPNNPQPITDSDGQHLTDYMANHWDDPKYRDYLANYMNTLQWWNCKVGWTGDPWGAPGQQVAVTGSQPCGSGTATCSFAATNGNTTGSTVTWGEDKTHSTTNGGSIGMDLGIGGDKGGPSAGLSGSYEHSVTDSVTHSSGQSFTDTTTFSYTNTLQQYPGTNAILTYTPNYDCRSNHLDCGGGWIFPLDTCSASGKGVFRIVYTSS